MDIISKARKELIDSIKKSMTTTNVKTISHSVEEESNYNNFIKAVSSGKSKSNVSVKLPLDFATKHDMFNLIKDGKVFIESSIKFISTFTNKVPDNKEQIQFGAHYVGHEFDYAFLDNHPGILNVDKLKDIPIDYEGLMAVPATVLSYSYIGKFNIHKIIYDPVYNGKHIYPRVVVSNKYISVK